METLPSELKWNIYRYLPIESILKACQVDRSFNQICNDDSFWRYLLRRDFNITQTTLDPKIKYLTQYIRNQTLKEIKNKSIFILEKESDDEIEELITVQADSVKDLYRTISDIYYTGEINNSETLKAVIEKFLNDSERIEGERPVVTPELIKEIIKWSDDLIIKETTVDFIMLES